MSSNITVEADEFAYALDNILKDVEHGINERLMPAVKKAARKGVKEEEWYAAAEDLVITGGYIQGIEYKTKGKKCEYEAEIGNKNKPGLAHLLEKGHATSGGGRVPGYPHIAPAAKVTFDFFEKEVSDSIDKALIG